MLARIYTLREMMQGCAERLPKVFNVLDAALDDENIGIRLQAAAMCMDRAFGKPRQAFVVADVTNQDSTPRRVLILPANNRKDKPLGPIIDAES
jgi:hypothetical protein